MTDITDDQEREARRVLDQMQGYVDNAPGYTGNPREWLRDLRAIFPAPAPTLAEEIRGLPDYTMSGDHCLNDCYAYASTLAEQTEQVEQERDEARAEVERLTEDRERWKEHALERQHIVERLVAGGNAATVAREENVAADQQGDPLPDPADVKPGEAWQVQVSEREAVANRDGTSNRWPWSVAFFDGEADDMADKAITLVRRLVPAPRVITNPDDFYALEEGTIVRAGDGHAWENVAGKWCGRRSFGAISTGALANFGPVTVLWQEGD